MAKRILIVGDTGNYCLETSYQHAFEELGSEVAMFDITEAIKRYARPGRFAYRLHQFFPVESWLRKANKLLAEKALSFKPDILIAFTNAQVLPGTFAYVKSVLPCSVIWYWADPLPNMNRFIHSSLPLADLLATYSSSTETVFGIMGAKSTCWLPFAGDPHAHYKPASAKANYLYDVSFVGSWRPEREDALRTIMENFPGLALKVNGPYWKRCSYAPLKKLASKQPLFGQAFTEVVQQSRLCLNVMDTNNYPAANMRFFEIPTAGGVQLCSSAPEVEHLFRNREHLLYFSDKASLVEQVQYALDNPAALEAIKQQGQQVVMSAHTYLQRAEAMLAACPGVL